MLNKLEIIPAIDIINGQCVRLKEGDFKQKSTYNISPLNIAKQFEEHGIQRVHIVDLDGAKNGKITNLKILENISKHTKLKIDFGGGVKTLEDVNNIFNAGASFITIGTLAIKNKTLWQQILQQFGTDKFLLGADVLNEQIKISGWLENTKIKLKDFLQENIALGVTQIFITDIAKDGLLKGPSVELYKQTIQQFKNIKLIASGGVNNCDDIDNLLKIGCHGVIIGKAIYENHIQLKDLKKYL